MFTLASKKAYRLSNRQYCTNAHSLSGSQKEHSQFTQKEGPQFIR